MADTSDPKTLDMFPGTAKQEPEVKPEPAKDNPEQAEKPKRKRRNLKPKNSSTQFVKFRAMNCFEDVHEKILQGWMPLELAKFIQEDQKEYTDVNINSLVDVITNYRASLPPGTIIERRLPAFFNKAVEKLDKGIDEVKELEWVAKFQKKRLKIDGAIEKKINKLMPSMTQEVRVMIEALRALSDVKMDLGISKRQLGELTVDGNLVANVVNHYGKASIAKALNNPESRQKILGVAESFLALTAASEESDDDIIDATVINADGSVVMANKDDEEKPQE